MTKNSCRVTQNSSRSIQCMSAAVIQELLCWHQSILDQCCMQPSPVSALLRFVSFSAGFDAAQEEKLGPVAYLDF